MDSGFFALFGVCFALDRPRAFGFCWFVFLDLGVFVFVCKLLDHFTCIAFLDFVFLLLGSLTFLITAFIFCFQCFTVLYGRLPHVFDLVLAALVS